MGIQVRDGKINNNKRRSTRYFLYDTSQYLLKNLPSIRGFVSITKKKNSYLMVDI